jgi:hypothetical protein
VLLTPFPVVNHNPTLRFLVAWTEIIDENDNATYTCNFCQDGKPHPPRIDHILRHEQSKKHDSVVKAMQNTAHQGASEEPVTSSPIPLSPEPSNFDTGFEDSLVQNAVDHLYRSVVYPDGLSELHPRPAPAPAPIFDWGVIKNRLEVQPAPTEDQLHGAQVLENLERYLKRDAALSDSEEERRSSSSESEESDGGVFSLARFLGLRADHRMSR